MTANQPPRPANMIRIVAINQGREPYTSRLTPLADLEARDVDWLTANGAVVVDARSDAAFAAGHLAGAYHIPYESSTFEQTAGWILPQDAPFILVLDDELPPRSALVKLAFVGLDRRAAGRLTLGRWLRAGRSVVRTDELPVEALAPRLSSGEAAVLDVREEDEWCRGHIAGALRMSYRLLPLSLADMNLDPGRPLAVVCQSGRRALIACSILQNRGFAHVSMVSGGMTAWQSAGLPVASGPSA